MRIGIIGAVNSVGEGGKHCQRAQEAQDQQVSPLDRADTVGSDVRAKGVVSRSGQSKYR